MCTASWSAKDGELWLCFNRDERKTRPAARLPTISEIEGRRYIAPIDPQGGGSWIAVNEYGVCSFLLNNYEASNAAPSSAKKSRGLLPIQLMKHDSVVDAKKCLDNRKWDEFAPFFIGLADGEGVSAYAWDGDEFCSLNLNTSLLTTSSYRSEEVQAFRKKRYAELLLQNSQANEEQRWNFHTGDLTQDFAFCPMMLRAESKTHSVSSIRISRNKVRFSYWETLGESRRLKEEVSLELPLLV